MILGAGGVLAYHYNESIDKAHEAEVKAQAAQASLDDANASKENIQRMLDDADEIAKQQKRRADALAKQAGEFDAKLAEARKEPNVKNWLDEPVPSAIRRMRRGSAGDSADNHVLPNSVGQPRPDGSPAVK